MQESPKNGRIRGRWVAGTALTLSLIILFIPSRTWLQVKACLSFMAANFLLYAMGSLASGLIKKRFGQESPSQAHWTTGAFTRIWLGQCMFLIALFPVMLLNMLLIKLTGEGLSLLPLAVLVIAALSATTLRKLRVKSPREINEVMSMPRSFTLLIVAASAMVSPVLAAYSSHLTAFGLDLHQHLYWTIEIYDSGHIPLHEAGTKILSDYPKGLHYLSASWTALGMNKALVLVFLKMMPFYQGLLFCLAITEILGGKIGLVLRSESQRALLFLFAGFVLSYFVYFVMKTPYPVMDLLGTPRFSATLVTMTPILLFYLTYLSPEPKLSSWALYSFPPTAAFCLAINPTLFVLTFTLILPMLLAHIFGFVRKLGLFSWNTGKKCLISCALSLSFLSLDPWVISRVPALSSVVESTFGYLTLERSVSLKVISPYEREVEPKKRQGPVRPAIVASASLRSLGKTLNERIQALPGKIATEWKKFLDLLKSPGNTNNFFASFLPLQGTDFERKPAPFLFLLSGAAFIILIVRYPGEKMPFFFRFVFVFVAVWSGIFLGEMATSWAYYFLEEILPSRMGDILRSYLTLSGIYLGSACIWLMIAGPVGYGLYHDLKARRAFTKINSLKFLKIFPYLTLGILAVGISSFLGAALEPGLKHAGWVDPIGEKDLRAIDSLNRRQLDGLVAIPAQHAVIGVENWLLPEGQTTSILPYIKLPMAFHLSLGSGALFSWRDFEERFCSKNPEVRKNFREKKGIRYLLVRKPGASFLDSWQQTTLCQKYSLEDFGLEKTPLFGLRGITLYRFKP